MKKQLFALLILLITFSCITIIPKKIDEKSSYIVIKEDYIVCNNDGISPTKINIKIYNDEISN